MPGAPHQLEGPSVQFEDLARVLSRSPEELIADLPEEERRRFERSRRSIVESVVWFRPLRPRS